MDRWIRNSSPGRLVFLGLLTLYVALIVAVVVGSPLDAVDGWVRTLNVGRQSPGWHRFALDYVMLGQRGPATAMALPWIGWLCYSRRTLDPAARLATALVLLNVSVGVVKVATGRWGPHVTARSRDVLAGGDIFPSGHISNAVVLFGILAMLAERRRTVMVAVAVWVSVTVGVGCLFLNTHWLTDVIGGWLAGGLVLTVVPDCQAALGAVARTLMANARRAGPSRQVDTAVRVRQKEPRLSERI